MGRILNAEAEWEEYFPYSTGKYVADVFYSLKVVIISATWSDIHS